MSRFLLLSAVLCGCSTFSYKHEPLYHNPIAGTRWGPLAPRPSPPFNAEGRAGSPGDGDVRARMVAEAEALLKNGAPQPGFGAADLEAMLKNSGAGVRWRADDGLRALVSLAKKKGAFYAAGRPAPGDIALFHDEWDANANGKVDDRLTGCGVVIGERGRKFEAVVRTDHAPRRVKVWPGGPAERIVDDEKANDFLRVPSRSDPPDTPYLAGQLYAGHIDVEKLSGRR